MPKISVIIPIFNDPESLPRAVFSAIKQNNLGEIIIVDDASTDNSLAVAKSLAATNLNIKVLRSPNNKGPAAARNLGAKHAEFEYLCFLDSDDELISGYFTDVLTFLKNNPTMLAAKVGIEFLDPIRGNILPDYDPRYAAAVFSSPCNVLIPRRVFLAMGGFSESAAFRTKFGGEDAAFCKAVAKHLAPLAKIDKIYYRCWSHKGSHLDRFLATTRLSKDKDGFEFVNLSPEQLAGGSLEVAIDEYINQVAINLGISKKSGS